MRIDIAAHVGHWPFRRFHDETCSALLDRMDRQSIDRAVVSNLHGLFYQNPQNANDELAEWLAAEPRSRDRLLPFGVLNPTYPGWRDDLAVCRTRYGFGGLRLYPQYHDYTLADPALADLLAVAEAERVPVAFSLRMIDARGRSWLDSRVVEAETEQLRLETLAHVIGRFPRLRVMVIQSILEQLTPDAVAILQAADILFDTTRATTVGVPAPNSYDLANESRRFGAGKFAFGSMTPFSDSASPVLRLTAGSLPAAETAAVFAGNARRFLEL